MGPKPGERLREDRGFIGAADSGEPDKDARGELDLAALRDRVDPAGLFRGRATAGEGRVGEARRLLLRDARTGEADRPERDRDSTSPAHAETAASLPPARYATDSRPP